MPALASFLVASLVAAGGPEAAGTLTGLRQESAGRLFRLVVDLDAVAEYSYHSPEPSLLILDFPGVESTRLPTRIEPERPEVKSIRVLPLPGGQQGTRLEVRLAAFVPYRIAAEGRSVSLTLEPPEVGATPSAPAATTPPEAAAPPPAPRPPPPAPRPAPRAAAGRILRLSWAGRGKEKAIAVEADGPLRYRDFVLARPDRVVVDFPGASFAGQVRTLVVNSSPVRRVRMDRYGEGLEGVARLVVDLSASTPYRIVPTGTGLEIVFGALP